MKLNLPTLSLKQSLLAAILHLGDIISPEEKPHEKTLRQEQLSALLRLRTILILAGFFILNLLWMLVDIALMPDVFLTTILYYRSFLCLLLLFSLMAAVYFRFSLWFSSLIYILPMVFFFFSYRYLTSMDIDVSSTALILTYRNIPLVIMGLIALIPFNMLQSLSVFLLIIIASYITYAGIEHEADMLFGTMWILVVDGIAAILASLTQFQLFSALTITSYHDPLTSALRRSPGEMLLANQMEHAKRHNSEFTLVMMDIDYFKSVNDMYGHLHGDKVLKSATKAILSRKRATDVFIRWGGEEFLLGLDSVKQEDLNTALSRIFGPGFGPRPDGRPLTISAGVASMREDNIQTLDDLTKLADLRVYQAKEAGRNKVIGASGDLAVTRKIDAPTIGPMLSE